MWLKWHWFVVIGLGTFACGPHVDSAFELVTFKVRTQVKFDIFLKVVQVGGSHDLTKNRCIFNKTRRSWLSGNWTFIFSFCPHDLSVNHLNRTPLWSLQRQKPKLHWYQISLWRVWTKNKDTCIILLFSCLLHIYIYTIYISILRAVCMHRMYLVRQISDWELQIVLELEAMGTFRRHLSVLLWKNSVLKRCSADLSLPSSKQEVTNLKMVLRRDNKTAILHLYPIIRYQIWNGSGTWCCIVHLSLSWIIQSNIRTAPMLLAVWAVSSHCFHCFIGAGKTFDFQPRGSVERSEMWMV